MDDTSRSIIRNVKGPGMRFSVLFLRLRFVFDFREIGHWVARVEWRDRREEMTGDGVMKIGYGHERLPRLNRHTIEWQSRGKNCQRSTKNAQKPKTKLTTPTQQSRSTTSSACSNPNARPAVSDNFPPHDTSLIPPFCFFSFPIPSPSFLPNAGSSKTKSHLFRNRLLVVTACLRWR